MGRPLELMEVASDKQNNPSSLQPSFFAITSCIPYSEVFEAP